MNPALPLDAVSLIAVYSAMGVYTLAFIAFAMDLSRRSVEAGRAAAAEREQELGGDGTAVLLQAPPAAPERRVWLRIGLALTVVGFVVHLVATVTRGIAAERVPWANMYEFALTMTTIIVAVFLGVQFRQDLRYLGTFIVGLVLALLGIATLGFYTAVSPLVPALQSYWLVIHVFVASLATAFLALGFALSLLQVLQARREAAGSKGLRFLRSLPTAATLEEHAYRLNIVGFVFWTFTLIAGAVWAEAAWGRYWGWDTKEVWTFIIWVVYAGYIHARATRGWRGVRSSVLSIVGFATIIFNYTVVNIYFEGLHAYSGL